MRPLKLTISAFCSYSGKTVIEMDRFGTNGLYLITGETGAGKTTIFDAITYALFGEASGESRLPSTLRSKYASPDAVTEVILTFAYDGSIYTVRRSPEYERPAKRGSERLTRKPAEAELTLPDGSVLTKIGDVNEKIREIISVDRGQFTRTVMIAQGDFVKLLTASTEERVEILRRVFKTDIFKRIQEGFTAKCRELDELYKLRSGEVKQYIGAFSCSPDDPLLPELERAKRGEMPQNEMNALLRDITAEQEQLDIQLGGQLKETDAELSALGEVITKAEAAEKNRRDLDAVNHKLAELNGENTRLKLALYSVAKKLPRAEELTLKIQTAADSMELFGELDSRNAELIAKRHEASEAVKRLRMYEDKLTGLLGDIDALKAELSGLEGAEATLASARSKLGNAEEKRSRLEAFVNDCKSFNSLTSELSGLSAKYASLSDELTKLTDSDNELAELKERCSELNTRKDALNVLAANAKEYEKTRAAAEKANSGYIALRAAYSEAEREFIDRQRRFYDQQAGILASGLRDGEPCPVCGSTSHPRPAEAPENAVSEAELKALEAKRSKLSADTNAASIRSGELSGALSNMLESLGKDYKRLTGEDMPADTLAADIAALLSECSAQVTETTMRLNDAAKRSARKTELTSAAVQLKDRITELTGRTEAMRGELAKRCEELLGTGLTESSAEAARSALSEYDKLISGYGRDVKISAKCVERRLEINVQLPQKEEQAAECRRNAASTGNGIAAANAAAEEIKRRTDELTAKLGYESRSEAQKHIEKMTAEKLAIEKENERAQNELERCGRQLAELSGKKTTLEQLISLAPETDGSAEKLRRGELLALREKLLGMQKDAGAVLLANRGLLQKIAAAAEGAAAVEKELIPMRTLADTANGTLTGRDKITLEAYAQTAYFDRIIALANLRLGRMTNGQYELTRRRTPISKSGKSGLDLDITDNFNGSVRDVRSLSGGESFKAALALALGLSDEIQSRSSVDLDTMFIDEGFGSLDENSLDRAVSVLSELSGSNRLIGIISHVDGLKSRIDRQLTVTKQIDPETGQLDTKVKIIS